MAHTKLSSQQIAAFNELFRQRSVTEAAVNLGITQSAVTQHLANLEKRVGVPLFMRYRAGLEPTKPAVELFSITDQVRTLEQLLAEKIGTYETLTSGHLTVVANAPRPGMPLIAAFSKAFPGVKINFSVVTWATSMQRLENSQVDIAIVTEPANIQGMFKERLMTQRMVALVRHDHVLARKKSLTLRELADNNLILPGEGTLTAREVKSACRRLSIDLAEAVEMSSYPVMKEAVLHGLGVAIALNDSMYPEEELVERPISDFVKDYETYLVTTATRRDLHFVRAFFDVALAAKMAR